MARSAHPSQHPTSHVVAFAPDVTIVTYASFTVTALGALSYKFYLYLVLRLQTHPLCSVMNDYNSNMAMGKLDLGVDDAADMAEVSALPELPPQFFVPRLEEKPQNPIMDTLRIMKGNMSVQSVIEPMHHMPLELHLLSEDLAVFEQEKKRIRLESVWEQAVSRNRRYVVRW